MQFNLDKNRPICPQICEHLCVEIASGNLKPQQRLLSVREVAVSAGVNPNTVQKSFEQLEQKGIIYSVRGSGWFVCDDTNVAKLEIKELINNTVTTFFFDMQRLGNNTERTKQIVKEWNL